MSLVKRLTEVFLERDYQIASGLCDSTVIGKNSKYITLYKYSGTALYFISIINEEQAEAAKSINAYLRRGFDASRQKINCGRAYFICLFTGDKAKLSELCRLDIEDYTTPDLEVRWIIDSNTGDITVLGQQPDKIADIRQIIQLAAAREGDEELFAEAAQISTLVDKERSKRQREVKSENAAFTIGIIVINLIIHFTNILMRNSDNALNIGAVSGELLFYSKEYYRLITSMFLHVDILHILSNMAFLYIFGSSVEKYYGRLRFLAVYFGSGIAGGVLYCLVSAGSAVGASGAVFGLSGAVLAYCLRKKHSIDGKDSYFMLMYLVISLCGDFLQINIDVANWAHIGGAFFGFILGVLLCPKNELKDSEIK